MSDVVRRWHEEWLGLVQPVDGLVVSIPVLVEAQCQQRLPSSAQQQLRELTGSEAGPPLIDDLPIFLEQVLGWTADMLASGDALPEELRLYVPEGRQLLRPSLAFLKPPDAQDDAELPDDLPPAARAGVAYEILLWDLPEGLALDKPETVTGSWDYPPSTKFDRLLRHCRVPIGLLTNRRELRLVYAPHGESSGSITFRLEHMVEPGGRPILDAFVMLLSAQRLLAVAEDRALPALLLESRRRQADVTNDLSGQIREALELLLAGFQAAAERDGTTDVLDHALAADSDGLYDGLLTVLLRLVFLLYAEERGLLPTEHKVFAEHYSLFALFDRLQADAGHHPDTMASRHGAWGQLLALFRAVHLGVSHGDLVLPARRGALFDPQRFPFLEGWGPGGSAPIGQADQRAATRTPTVDDGTVHAVLSRLLYLAGQRLSYRALDVEQIGSVYEGLMGWRIERRYRPSVCLRPARVWVSADEVLAIKPAQRARWLKDECGLPKAQATKLADGLKGCDEERALEVLAGAAVRGSGRAGAGKLVLQPGPERRRTSSHYTPRSLAEPVVATTLEPLLAALGDEPRSEQILDLKVCDPAMGSGAFLVAACRWLGDRLVAAWTREGRLGASAAPADGEPGAEPLTVADSDDPVLLARRLVAQRCLYGVDKNAPAVHLAKLSLWLVTMSRELPFTFVDHALRHGDAMVGLSFEQLRAFHWAPQGQQELVSAAVDAALDEAIALRQAIHELADDQSPAAWREKEGLLRDADDALDRVRLVGDLVVGAFFAESKAKARSQERDRRLAMVAAWLTSDEPPTDELLALRDELRREVPAFHWMLEFPEVFYDGRPDPLSAEAGGEPAYLDAFVGNAPFLGGKRISTEHGDAYAAWLAALHGSSKNADLAAHFFRRAQVLLGEHGTIGLIATNTIGQGDTRKAGLQHLLATGGDIYHATSSMPWPGDAAVAVSVVHVAQGATRDALADERWLDGKACPAICSRLRGSHERADPVSLAANAGCSFIGSYILGMGFTLTPDEREQLLARDPANAERIFPYLGGEEVNTSPTQGFHRYVINFGDMSLEEAERWPDLLKIVRERVKPERDVVKRAAHRKHWWHYGDKRPELYKALAEVKWCLVGARVTKHLCIARALSDRVYAESTTVFPLDTATALAVLQSRIHERWARLLSSSLEDRLRYAATDCFETFPFPAPDPRTVHPELEDIGERLDAARSAYMVATDQGLTKTYNQLKDPDCRDPRVEALRALHVELDQRVLAAYGWDIGVPSFAEPRSAAELAAFEAFENAVLDRLFLLNAERAAEEKAAGAVAGKRGKTKAARKAKPKKASRQDRDQAQLFDPGGPEAP